MNRPLRAVALAAATIAAAGVGPPSTAAATVPDPIDDVRHAKLALVEFLLDHVDRPSRINEPCPTLPAEAAGQLLVALGAVPSSREYGVAVVFDPEVGGGLTSLRCGVDIARAAEPPDSVSLSVDVTALDGQATFDQYAVALGGTDVEVVAIDTPSGGRLVQRCTNSGRDCTTAIDLDGLVITTRVRHLPTDTGAQLAAQLTAQTAPGIVSNLASLSRGDA